ncbi:MAG: dTDP-4-dehydrorhamnose 3,5-epimerase family protein [Candidatus Altiarchaeota archaeon]
MIEIIEGVLVKKLKPIHDDRGWLMEIMRRDDDIYDEFGQVYMTTAYPGVIKAWHSHRNQDDHFCVLKGMAWVALYDDREDSPTHGEVMEFNMGEDNPLLVKIPRGVHHGFTPSRDEIAYVLNVPTNTYNYKEPDEIRVPHDAEHIPYEWKPVKK